MIDIDKLEELPKFTKTRKITTIELSRITRTTKKELKAICENKCQYQSKERAKSAKKLISNDKLRIYRCSECGKWHLTATKYRL